MYLYNDNYITGKKHKIHYFVLPAMCSANQKNTKIQFIYLFIYLFTATPVEYGRSWARDRIEASATGLFHKHSNQI